MNAAQRTVDDYMMDFPADVQAILQRLRTLAHEVEPELSEAISYGIPTLRLKDKNAFHFGAYPSHISVYPVPADPALQKELTPYVKGKGTLQFQLASAIPYQLIRRVFEAHVQAAWERINTKDNTY